MVSLSLKKLVQMAKKWQRIAALGRRRITMVNKVSYIDNDHCSTTQKAEKGHFVVYSIDGKRYVIPLVYLNSIIVERLFKLSEEEFGFTVEGPITLPCDGVFMEYVIDLIKKGVSEEVESAFLSSLLLPCSYVSCSVQKMEAHGVKVCSF